MILAALARHRRPARAARRVSRRSASRREPSSAGGADPEGTIVAVDRTPTMQRAQPREETQLVAVMTSPSMASSRLSSWCRSSPTKDVTSHRSRRCTDYSAALGRLRQRPLARADVPRATKVHRADAPNQVWSWDITCCRRCADVLRLYLVMDVWSRRIVGWEIA